MTFTQTVRSALAASAVLAMMATTAAAADRVVTIVNQTGYTIIEFYGSNIGSDSWEEDILGYDVIPNNSTMRINFDDGSGYCMFDFKAVFDDGDVMVEKRINVCEIGTYTYN